MGIFVCFIRTINSEFLPCPLWQAIYFIHDESMFHAYWMGCSTWLVLRSWIKACDAGIIQWFSNNLLQSVLTPSVTCIQFHVAISQFLTNQRLDSEYNEELNEDDSQSDEKEQDCMETDSDQEKDKIFKAFKIRKKIRSPEKEKVQRNETVFHYWQPIFIHPIDQSSLPR